MENFYAYDKLNLIVCVIILKAVLLYKILLEQVHARCHLAFIIFQKDNDIWFIFSKRMRSQCVILLHIFDFYYNLLFFFYIVRKFSKKNLTYLHDSVLKYPEYKWCRTDNPMSTIKPARCCLSPKIQLGQQQIRHYKAQPTTLITTTVRKDIKFIRIQYVFVIIFYP